MSDSNVKIPAKVLLLALVGLIAAALLVLFLVYPVWSKIQPAEARLRNIQTQVQVKEILLPTFSSLRAAEERIPEHGPYLFPDKVPLAQDMDQLSNGLLRMTESHGLVTRSVSPALHNLANEPRRIVVVMEMRGPLDAFRSFLLDLLEQPHLDAVHAMRLKESGANREYHLEFSLHN